VQDTEYCVTERYLPFRNGQRGRLEVCVMVAGLLEVGCVRGESMIPEVVGFRIRASHKHKVLRTIVYF
jgi:hypothetical protein